MFLSESMYGLGMYDLAMPRAAYQTLSDRRRLTKRILFLDRRSKNVRQSILSIVLGLLIHNFPWIQVLVLSFVSLLCFALIYMISKTIPERPARQLSMSVDMIISVIEEEKAVLPSKKVEQKPTLEPVVKAKHIEKPKPAPIQEEKITLEISLPNMRVIPKIKKRPKITQFAASKNSSFDKTTQNEEIIRISGSVVPERNYSINRNLRKFRATQPDFISNSFSKQPDTPAVIIFQANSSQKKYTINTSNQRISTPSDKMSGSNVFGSSQSIKSNNMTLPETNQINERYSLAKHGGPYQLSPLSQTDNQSLSFAHQNKKEHLTLTPLINTKSVSKKSRPIQGDPIGGKQAPDFSSAMTVEIDPTYLINLKKFSVCADPEEEFRLKTELAARLDGPSKFAKNGIIFFFKYTETGYTIDIDIYNPQGERFQDRCSVLHLAIESIENSKK